MAGRGNNPTLMGMYRNKNNQRLLLAGGGHSHILMLRFWSMYPAKRPKGLITLINRNSKSLYSGMVPGLVSNLYTRNECEIDLRRLCRLAGIIFIQGEIISLDIRNNKLQLVDKTGLQRSTNWDLLSLNVGSESIPINFSDDRFSDQKTTKFRNLEVIKDSTNLDSSYVYVKPLEPFLDWLETITPKTNIIVLGGGAAAIEIALSLRKRWPSNSIQIQLFPKNRTNSDLLDNPRISLGNTIANRFAIQHLEKNNIQILEKKDYKRINRANTIIIGCTGSKTPEWLSKSGLPIDDQGRVITNMNFEVFHNSGIFATGDCGIVAIAPKPPSGVWAVRSSSILRENIDRFTREHVLKDWQPQRQILQLLGDSQGNALAIWGSFAINYKHLIWKIKYKIDQTFIQLFSNSKAMKTNFRSTITPSKNDALLMPCSGCAAKLSAAPLEAVLQKLSIKVKHKQFIPEDAHSLLKFNNNSGWLQSIDGFPALINDPWLNGRITALHACSDLWACGADVRSVQVFITLPQTNTSLQEELLLSTMEGILSILTLTGAKLMGGHTLESRQVFTNNKSLKKFPLKSLGDEIQLGLVVNGQYQKDCFWSKSDLKSGDVLILSRPIGTGVLFAAAMMGAAKPEWIDTILDSMQQSQSSICEILAHYTIHSTTDITGFGLLGHLGEMVKSSNSKIPASFNTKNLIVLLEPSSIKTFPGVIDLLNSGFTSTLALPNRVFWELLDYPMIKVGASNTISTDTLLELLVDPQTCGPLLIALPEEESKAALVDLHANGFKEARIIGQIQKQNNV